MGKTSEGVKGFGCLDWVGKFQKNCKNEALMIYNAMKINFIICYNMKNCKLHIWYKNDSYFKNVRRKFETANLF